MKTWKLKESKSDELLIYLKNYKTEEETTINLLDYKNTFDLISGCLKALNAKDSDLGRIFILRISEKKIEELLDYYSYDIIKVRRKGYDAPINKDNYWETFPVSLKELDENPQFLDMFFGNSDEENMFKWYETFKKSSPIDTKEGESVLRYFEFFNNFNFYDYTSKYIGYFESKEDWLNYLIKHFMELYDFSKKEKGLYSLIQRYLEDGLQIGLIVDTQKLGEHLFKEYNLEKYTPDEIEKVATSLKLNPDFPYDPIEFIGDYEDYGDFEISTKENKQKFKDFLNKHHKEIQIMSDPNLYKNNRNKIFYNLIVKNYIETVHYNWKHFFENEYSLLKDFIDFNKLADALLEKRLFFTYSNFYYYS